MNTEQKIQDAYRADNRYARSDLWVTTFEHYLAKELDERDKVIADMKKRLHAIEIKDSHGYKPHNR